MMRTLMFLLQGKERHGWLFFVSLFYPVYWSQDLGLKNKGYDIPSLWMTNSCYNRATWWGKDI